MKHSLVQLDINRIKNREFKIKDLAKHYINDKITTRLFLELLIKQSIFKQQFKATKSISGSGGEK